MFGMPLRCAHVADGRFECSTRVVFALAPRIATAAADRVMPFEAMTARTEHEIVHGWPPVPETNLTTARKSSRY